MMKTIFGVLAAQLKLVPVTTIPVIVPWIVIVSSIENACIATLLWVELDLVFYKGEIEMELHSE